MTRPIPIKGFAECTELYIFTVYLGGRISRLMPKRSIALTAVLVCELLTLANSSVSLHAQTNATFGQVIPLGATPADVVLDGPRQSLYLVNQGANRIDIFSTTTNSVIGNIPVGHGPLAAAMSMDGAYLYVTNPTDSTVSLIDLTADSVVQTVSLPVVPQGVAVGADGRALIGTLGTTSGSTTINTLLIFDRTQAAANQFTAVATPTPPAMPAPLPAITLARPSATFPSRLIRTPNGQYIVGLIDPKTTETDLFVYEVSSGSILSSRTVTGQSTVLSMSPDGSRFMAGYTLYDVQTLSILAQMNNANAPFAFTAPFSALQNAGGSVFSPDGKTLYGAFNTAAATLPLPAPISSTLLVSDPSNLAIQMGIRLPENILAKMVVSPDGANAWGLSQSGLIWLPLSTLYQHPILAVDTTQVFLTQNPCNPGIAEATVHVSNIGGGKLIYAIATINSALTAQVSTGVAPSTITLTMEPRGVVRQNGTNLVTGGATLSGQSLDVSLVSQNAINLPPVLRVYMNQRSSAQRGVIFPLPTTPNNSSAATTITATANTVTGGAEVVDGDQGLEDILLDPVRNLVYITNAGYNRIEVFDTIHQRFLSPIPVNQMPHQMTMLAGDSNLYVAGTGGELIDIVSLNLLQDTGHISFPPIPRQAGGSTAALLYPAAVAMGLNGLEFVMSNGTQWAAPIQFNCLSSCPASIVAAPRAADTVTAQTNGTNTLTTPVNMLSSPDGQTIVTLAGNGNAYVYNGSADAYVASGLLFPTPIQGFYGPLGADPAHTYLTLGGLYTNQSLSVLGGAANASTATSGALRNVVSTAPFGTNGFVRLSTPVRTSITTTPTSNALPTLELINTSNGSSTLLAAAPENPRFTVFGTTRFNIQPRSMVVDQNNVAYVITASGLSVIPLTPGVAPVPQIAATNGIVNSGNGSASLPVGGFVTVNGSNLATAATANTLPAPTVLGGSCVLFNDVPLPLLQTSAAQISAQIPATVSTGTNIVQVISLATGQSSATTTVTVSAPASTSGTTGVPPRGARR